MRDKVLDAKDFSQFVESRKFHVLDSMEDLVRIRDKEGKTLFENKAMLETLERVKKEGKKNASFDLPEQVLLHQNSIKREVEINGKIYSVKASPVFGDDKKLEGYVEVFRDITSETNISLELFNANKKMNDDVILARNIQMSILPRIKHISNVYFQYGHVPSNNLSGDIFDVIEIDHDKIGVYMADVVGHGISASIMTMFIRQAMRNILMENPNLSPSDTLLELKKMFTELGLDASQYFTIVYMLIDLPKDKIIYVNAGHNCMPILFNKNRQAYMRNRGRFISSIFPDLDYVERELDIIEGDKILLYTDGLLETANQDGEFFGEERLLEWVKNNKGEKAFVKELLKHLDSYRYLEQKDDVAILYLDIRGKK